MDAVEFLKEYRRMCNKYIYSDACGEDCSCECGLYGEHCDLSCNDMDANDVVYRVQQWSQDHPQKTMMQDFFEKFPNAPKSKFNHPTLCPGNCGYNNETPSYKICNKFDDDCLKCWSRPLED